MINEQNISEWAERYLNGGLSIQERGALTQALKENPSLQNVWKEAIELQNSINDYAERKNIADLISSVGKDFGEKKSTTLPFVKPESIRFKSWYRAAAAAGLILLSAATTALIMNKNDSSSTDSQYTQLRREIETIKKSHVQLIDSIQKGNHEEMMDPALYGGTGFAVSNNGFVATNYHVVKEANSIYVQSRSGKNHKAYIYAFEPNSDIAILKIEEEGFVFGKNPLPYSISRDTSALGQRVYTIGYPQEEVVYNEGYISCETGYMGDAASYQLEMTSNPGQSGAPVLDNDGSVIGLITGKKANTTGTTFAVQSKALINLIHTLPSESSINYPTYSKVKKLNRSDQVQQIRGYIFSIKVN